MDDLLPDYMSHDQIVAGIQRYYDLLWELHDDYQNEENHVEKETILGLIDTYSEIFESFICYKR